MLALEPVQQALKLVAVLVLAGEVNDGLDSKAQNFEGENFGSE